MQKKLDNKLNLLIIYSNKDITDVYRFKAHDEEHEIIRGVSIFKWKIYTPDGQTNISNCGFIVEVTSN